ncbi:hypothetical protein M413DRAFT_439058 [Hebeloma cylindrosporum]|uniref:Uncharacterized protein n=1 Tax=Hebeloma cylindrosporum TaxID=76867 RepID=A0A0C2Z9Y3_HEBCY|nr:hypothetical protein M413DRAFT_439058 [Hebeloma cylindrosporum h7]
MDGHYLEEGEHAKPVYYPPAKPIANAHENMADSHPPQHLTNTPPHFPLPDLPPNDDVRSYRGHATPPPIPPVPPKPSAPPRSFPPSKDENGDVRSRPEAFSTSKKAKRSSSKAFARRLLEELDSLQYEHSSYQSHHIHNEDDSLPRASSPTNSHPSRPRHRSYSRARSSSESMSALLVITTERLAQETARANGAEREAAEVLAVFKTTHEAKARLEKEINRVREELGLYKIQLDLAQKEIFRAQDVVNKLERQRVDAENEAVRSRDKIRKLMETRAVEQAMEEGRRLGFEEGLKQGRSLHPVPEASPPKSQERRRSARTEGNRGSVGYPKSESSGSSRSSETHERVLKRTEPEVPKSTKPISQPVPSTSRPRRPSIIPPPHGTPPDVARYPKTLPVRTVTTPMDVQVPSTQPQPPQPMPPHQPPTALHSATTKPAERITVQPSAEPNEPIHPIPIHNHSPSVSHRSIVLPPDNYIPTLGPDSLISLPPPHELSQPVPPAAPSTQNPPRSRSNSRAPDVFDDDTKNEVRRYAERDRRDAPPLRARNPERDSRRYGAAVRSMSVTSRGSTRLSELDLLGPPRNGLAHGGGHDPESPSLGRRSRPRASTQPITERIVEQWRHANPEYRTPSPPASRREEIEIQPPTLANSTTSRRVPSSTVYGSRPIRSPRSRPREIIMPVPLGDPLLTPNMGRGSTGLPDAATRENHYPSQPTALNRQRTTSSATVPAIDVVTPTETTRSNLSIRTVIDPVLLTPESANLTPLPEYSAHEPAVGDSSLGLMFSPAPTGGNPSNNVPASFVSLSPIPGMGSLNSYPPGFAPSLPKDHPGGGSPDFRYSASPLAR